MDSSMVARIASLMFSVSGVLLLSILGFLLITRAVLPTLAGLVTSYRQELRDDPFLALLSGLMLFFLSSILVLAIYDPNGLRSMLRPIVFAY
jgi:hypothetical protein